MTRVQPIVLLVVAAAAASIAAAAPALADNSNNNNSGSCQFSAGMGPNSACANGPQDDDYSDFVWPGTPGFAPGGFGPGFGIGFGGF